MKSFDILEKFQNELYNKEMIEIKETVWKNSSNLSFFFSLGWFPYT